MTAEGTAPSTSRSPLEGALARLRAVEESDLVWINRNFWNPEVTRFLTVVWPEPLAGTRAFWQRSRTSDDTIGRTATMPRPVFSSNARSRSRSRRSVPTI